MFARRFGPRAGRRCGGHPSFRHMRNNLEAWTGMFNQQQQPDAPKQEQGAPPTAPPFFGFHPDGGIGFLREVGEQVAAALSNLGEFFSTSIKNFYTGFLTSSHFAGINVDVDVEHEGKKEKVTPPKEETKPEEKVEAPTEPAETKTADIPVVKEASAPLLKDIAEGGARDPSPSPPQEV